MKLLSVDGKIPVLQILIGIIIGAIGMFLYAKFYRPKVLYETELIEEIKAENGKQVKGTVRQQKSQQQPTQVQREQVIVETTDGNSGNNGHHMPGPSFVDLRQIPLAMPKLSAMYAEQEDYPEDEEDEDEDEDDEQEIPQV